MGRTTILIWGGLIFAYLVLVHSGDAATVTNAVSNFAGGITRNLQGRR